MENVGMWSRHFKQRRMMKAEQMHSDIKTKQDLIKNTRRLITTKLSRPKIYIEHPEKPIRFYETYFDVTALERSISQKQENQTSSQLI